VATLTPDSTREDVEARLLELRKDFIEIPLAERESRSQEVSDRVISMIQEVEELDKRLTLEDLADLQRDRKKALEEQRRSGFSPAAGRAPMGGPVSTGMAAIAESQEWKDWESRGMPFGDAGSPGLSLNEMPLRMDAFETRAVNEWTSGGPPNLATGDAGLLLPVAQPIAPVPRQARLFIRDLLPKMTTQYAQIPYVRELSPTATELGASAVSEGVTKPDNSVNFQSAVALVTVIAATMRLSKQIFADAPAVVAYVNQRLPYLIKYKENDELLNGSGNWPDLLGILNVAGVQSQTFTAGEVAISIGNSYAKVENNDGTPTGVVMNPTDAWGMFVKRAAGGSGTFDAGTPFDALPLTIWGVPSYRTRAQAAGHALVGDWELGGMIADREQVNLRIYDQPYAESNQVLLIVEERLAALWPRPDLFVNVAVA
jgi:HK97 family phage major capsid protein